MIFGDLNTGFKDEQWIYIISQYLNSWTEIPLNVMDGYNIDELKFYDGLLGYLLKDTEKSIKYCPDMIDREFVKSWKYQGKIYRIIHHCIKESNKTKCGHTYRMPKINYHGMIAHWTSDYTFEGMKHKLSPNKKFIILEADTKNHIAFNINKFRKTYKK